MDLVPPFPGEGAFCAGSDAFRAALRLRRERLASALNGKSALLFCGYEIPRTAVGVCYRFRPSSHALYFGGVLPAASVLLVTPRECVLYAHHPTVAEQVWGGNGETLSELAEARGIERVASLEELISDISHFASGELLSLPLLLTDARAIQEALLGRAIDLEGVDGALAEAVIALRLQHDSFAIHELRRAGTVSAAAHKRASEVADIGVSTHRILAALREVAVTNGCEESFEPIVSPHGEILHNTSRGEILRNGDLLLVDFGVETSQGYAGDLTRTWPIGTAHSALARDIYGLIERLQQRVLDMVRPGEEYRVLHETACRELLIGLHALGIINGDVQTLFERGLHTLFFPHGIGHLIGLDVHDMEDLGDLASYERGRVRSSRFGDSFLRLDRKLHTGMVVSIEPGIYFIPAILQGELGSSFRDSINQRLVPELLQIRGIRIEDAVLVTDEGREVLTDGVSKEWGGDSKSFFKSPSVGI